MKRAEERPVLSPSFSSKTFTWVGAAHLLILLGLGLLPFLFKPQPEEKKLVMVDLGTSNPGNGSPSGSNQGGSQGGNPGGARNSQSAPPPAAPPKKAEKAPVEAKKPDPVKEEVEEPKPVKVEPKIEPKVEKADPKPVKQEAKVEKVIPKETKVAEVKPVKPKTDPAKPKNESKATAKTPVKVEIGKPVKRTVAGSSSPSADPDGEESGKAGGVKGGVKEGTVGGVKGSTGLDLGAKGPSASDIRGQLSKGLQSVGVVGGTGSGAAGSPDGSAYNALIKKTLVGNWSKPAASGGSLKTLVKIRVRPDGTVELVGLSGSSGDKAMDQSVLDAVRASGRLAKPLPEGLGSPDYEVVVNFQLD
jgi:TonB family protein